MDLKDYLRIARDRWLLVVVVCALSVVAAASYTVSATPQYQSSARLFVKTPAGDSGGDLQQGGQFSQQRVKSYATLIKGEEVASRVVEKLGIDETPQQLMERISTSVELDTVVLSVSVTDPSPERAQELTQTVAETFTAYVRELETPDGEQDAPVKASIVDRATVPDAAVSPRPARNLGLAFVLGLLVGFGLAVLRDLTDNRIRSREQISAVSGREVPVLGDIHYDRDAVRSPLIGGLSAHHPRMEALRVLRTNLQFIDAGSPHKCYVITSSVPSEGKTSTSANLAKVMAESGQRVLLIEADLRRPKLAEYLKLEGSVGVTTILLGRVDAEDAIQQVTDRLDLLPSGRIPPNPAELLESSGMGDLLARVRQEYDVVLIDAPPLLPVTDAAPLAAASDGAIMIVKHNSTTTDQYAAALERLSSVDARLCGTVVTMSPSPKKRRRGSDYGYGYGYGYGYEPETGGRKRPRVGSGDARGPVGV